MRSLVYNSLAEYGDSVALPSRLSILRAVRLPRRWAAPFLLLGMAALPCPGAAQNIHLTPLVMSKCAPDLCATLQACAAQARFPVLLQTDRTGLETVLNGDINSVNSGSARLGAAVQAVDGAGTYAAQLTADQIARLAADPHVRQVSPDRPLYACQDYLVQTVGADVAWASYGVTGRGVTVAVLDTGLSVGPDIAIPNPHLLGWMDLVNHRSQPYDDNGHGTHVAGILAGNGFMALIGHYNTSLRQIAPEVSLVGVKVLDKTGSGSASTVIAGIDWCIANRARLHIRIINLSLGHPVAESYKTDPLCQACERAWSAGILVVCAAGNAGRSVPSVPTSAPAYGTIVAPGNDPYVLTVGATDTFGTATRADDTIASYSSRGPSAVDLILKPDIVAPGNRIDSLAAPNSLLYTQYPANRIAPAEYHGSGPVAYYRLSGTSMAAPVVAGAAALMLQADPTLTPDTIKARLMVSATKSSTLDPFSYGAGYLNIPAALACRAAAPLGALSPATYTTPDGMVRIDTSVWGGDDQVWGENAIWGGSRKGCKAIWGGAAWLAGSLWNNILWSGAAQTTGSATEADMTAVLLNGD